MVTIVDYGMGNLASIRNMLKKIGVSSVVSSSPEDILCAEQLILPGVGGFSNGIERIAQLNLRDPLNCAVLQKKVPILGICLGLQLMCKKSEEGQGEGLGWFDADVVKFKFSEKNTEFKVPHVGWNYIESNLSSSIELKRADPRFYFVHSYHVSSAESKEVIFKAKYGYEFICGLQRDNITGVQFHPEKSHGFGIDLLKSYFKRNL